EAPMFFKKTNHRELAPDIRSPEGFKHVYQDQVDRLIDLAYYTWLTQYRRSTNPKDSDNDAAPLRDFRVKIDPVPNRAGCYTCNVRLQPHFQIDYVISEFELSTEIKQAV
ncbi:MAG: hypothetical protein AAF511_00795, partial [Pseudomonadota bacterium]